MAQLLRWCTVLLILEVALQVLASDEVKKKTEQDNNDTKTVTITTIEVSKSLPKVCDVCRCTEKIIDCSSLNLNSNLYDHEWPKGLIETVTFDNNNITEVKQFPKTTIIQLNLANNKIQKIEIGAFKWLTNLTELDLSHNELSYENLKPNAFQGPYNPEAYEPLEKLKKLNLSFNKFHSLNHDLFEHVLNLETLILSNNPFTILNPSSILAISGVPYLKELQLSGCQLEKLDEITLHSLRFLKKLNVSYNEFKKLPEALRQARVLEILTLDGNPIEYLGYGNIFPKMPHLKVLNMANMPELTRIDEGSLSNLEALEVLNIKSCPKLKEVSDLTFSKLANLNVEYTPSSYYKSNN